MSSFLRSALGILLPLVAALVSTASPGAVAPLPRAHAHNDYEHARPLLDALDQGFCSVEADIHLVEGELRVAHDLPETRPGRTLQSLYLEPLRERVRANGGRVYPEGPLFTLLVDLKTDAATTYPRLREVLSGYRDILTVFRNDRTATNAVTVILSGNRPWETLAAETERLAGLDGRLPDLDRAFSPHLVPLVSDNWRNHFRWDGTGPFPEAERTKLLGLVRRAHANGQRIRFWAAPDRPEVWRVHADAGVDLINTDKLAELAAFLRGR